MTAVFFVTPKTRHIDKPCEHVFYPFNPPFFFLCYSSSFSLSHTIQYLFFLVSFYYFSSLPPFLLHFRSFSLPPIPFPSFPPSFHIFPAVGREKTTRRLFMSSTYGNWLLHFYPRLNMATITIFIFNLIIMEQVS